MEANMAAGRADSNLEDFRVRANQGQCPRDWEWPCENGECIARYDRCDGIAQCTDGSDEWRCQYGQLPEAAFQANRQLQQKAAATVAPTQATTLTTESYVILTKRQLFTWFVIFLVLAMLIVYVIRKRARRRALMRNRRGNILEPDSDSEDVLISSMYAS
ncbi:hypothetical protein WR25_13383 [Diploscapter pachys]|uniref:Low-density lipoprotein receptor domain class A n=1 Tax=Diploscapter pachys TaxID=2018661 RepID=A0A2A2J2R0_9BILA|nr:hypothetical protein WR25_13383 [Diploscapter pachys]